MTRLVGTIDNFNEKIIQLENKNFFEWKFDVITDDGKKISIVMHGSEPSFKLQNKTRVRLYELPDKDTNYIEKIDDLTNNVIVKFSDDQMPKRLSTRNFKKILISIIGIAAAGIIMLLQSSPDVVTSFFDIFNATIPAIDNATIPAI